MSNKSHVRPGYSTVTTGLNVKSPEEFIAWAERALGAEIAERFQAPDGRIMHAIIRIGDTKIGVDPAIRDPETKHALFHIYTADADAAYQRAVAAGSVSKMPPTDMFFGERVGVVADANGNSWAFSTFKEELSPEEIQRRGAEFMAQQRH